MCHRRNWNRRIIANWKSQPLRPDSNNRVSGEPGAIQTKRRAWTDPELVRLLQGITGDLTTMTILALYTGCRENELAEAKLEDIHGEYLHIPEAKSAAGVRDIPIHPVIQPLVNHLQDNSTDGYLVSGLKRGGEDNKRHHLFAKRFSYRKKQLGFPSSVVFHSFRANYVSRLVALGTPDSTIQQLIGHESGVLLHNTYSSGLGLDALQEVVRDVEYGKAVTGAVSGAVGRLIA
jgi:integrase